MIELVGLGILLFKSLKNSMKLSEFVVVVVFNTNAGRAVDIAPITVTDLPLEDLNLRAIGSVLFM